MLTRSQFFQHFLFATLFVARAHARGFTQQYFQLGDDFDGVGNSVSVSADGTRFVSSNPFTDQIYIYEYLGGAWKQLGDTISVPSGNYDYFGASVSMSADGTRVAIGAVQDYYDSGYVRIYEEVSGTWTQIGGEIQGPPSSSKQTQGGVKGGIGYSVSMSSDGERLAIGAPTFNSVLMYEYDAGKSAAPANWKQVGSILDPESGNSALFGNSVSLSSDGLRVAIGAMYVGGRSGKVDIYEDLSGEWSKIGDAVMTSGEAGFQVSISADGTRVAIGALRGSYSDITKCGLVRIYQDVSGIWEQVGADIAGSLFLESFGQSLSMSADGKKVAISSPYANSVEWYFTGAGASAGKVDIYEEVNGTWFKIGVVTGSEENDNLGKTGNTFGCVYDDNWVSPTYGSCSDYFLLRYIGGNAVSMSANGTVVIAGAAGNGQYSRAYRSTHCRADNPIDHGPGTGCPSKQYTLASGSSGNPTCNAGYTLTGSRSCNTGTLTDTAVCNPDPCIADVAIGNGFASPCSSSLASGSSCNPTCNAGYTLTGSRSCNAGTLTDTAVCSANACAAADVAIDNGFASPCSSSLASGSSCNPTCNAGYTLTGSRSCNAGTLTDTAVCNPISCTASSDSSKDGSDGSLYCINGGTVGGTTGACSCTSCNAGYEGTSCQTASTPPSTAGDAPKSETQEKAETTRDAMLNDITDEKMRKKAELLANAAIGGEKVKKISGTVTAPDEDTACSHYYTMANLDNTLGACVATVTSRRRARSLMATTYDVSIIFTSDEVDDATLTAAADSLEAHGVTGVDLDVNLDPIAELKTIEGVDATTLATFETEAAAASAEATATAPPSPSAPAELVVHDISRASIHQGFILLSIITALMTL